MSHDDVTTAAELLAEAQVALRTSLVGLGRIMGISRRTMTRWMRSGGAAIYPSRAEPLARAVHPVSPALAERIAAAGGLTLAGLGLRAPGAEAEAALTRTRVDAVVCAAAEALDASPRAARRALRAAARRAREEGLTLEALEAGLGPAAAPAHRRHPKG